MKTEGKEVIIILMSKSGLKQVILTEDTFEILFKLHAEDIEFKKDENMSRHKTISTVSRTFQMLGNIFKK